jgi:hypothetical protein
METKTLNYAKQYIDFVAEENGFITFICHGKLYIQFPSGRNFELSESEVLYQATEYLESEKQMLNS